MAGKRGMKGPGLGGKRPGAGRKPQKLKPAPVVPENAAPATETPLEFMLRVMNDPEQSVAIRAKMAVTAAQYIHLKKGDGGIKDGRKEAAGRVIAGKFGAAAPPKLAAVK